MRDIHRQNQNIWRTSRVPDLGVLPWMLHTLNLVRALSEGFPIIQGVLKG